MNRIFNIAKKAMAMLLAFMISIISSLKSAALNGSGSLFDPYVIADANDWLEVMKNMRENKNWSDGKHFVLKNPIILTGPASLSYVGMTEYAFNGIFNGNDQVVTLSSSPAFGSLGKSAKIKKLRIAGYGHLGEDNEGNIEDCVSMGTSSFGIVRTNKGTIKDCIALGNYSSAGLVYSNYGEILRCTINGAISGPNIYGLAYDNYGSILNCRVEGLLCGSSNSAGLLGINRGKIKNCTFDGRLESPDGVYLIYSSDKEDTKAEKCTVGEKASEATEERMFGPGYPSENIEQCGYVGFDQEDYCDLRTPTEKVIGIIKDIEEFTAETAIDISDPFRLGPLNNFGPMRDVKLGIYATLADAYIKAPVELVTWLPGKFDCLKEEMEWIRDKVEIPSRFFEGMAHDPLVFKVSKIGGDIACLFIGVKGAITAVTKTGKLIKIGRTTSGMGKFIPVNFRPGLMPVATAGSSALALEAAPQMIIENVEEASKALGILKSTLMQAGKVAGSGVVAGGGGFSLAHDVSSASSTAPQPSTSCSGWDRTNFSSIDEGLNFSGIASEHMTDPNRHIPVQILCEVIKTGKAMPDPRGSRAIMYYGKMFRGTKPYNVEVLYDKISNTVYHFKYSSEALGPLAAIK